MFQNEDDATSCKLKSPCFDSDHRLVMAELVTRSAKEHQRHVKKTKSFPIPIRPKGGGGIGDETLVTLFKAAKELDKKKTKKDPKGEIRSWILEKTFGLMRKKALARRFNQ
jgi:hypothetical protein